MLNIQNNSYNTNFNAWNRDVYKPSIFLDRLKHRNDTRFCRDTWVWMDLMRAINVRYKNCPKINVYSYGCSDGSEPYSFLINLFSRTNENIAEKCLPIIAIDYDPEAILRAKNNRYTIQPFEVRDINNCSKEKFEEYFEELPKPRKSFERFYRAKPVLTDNVIFREADILTDYQNIEPNDSIVLTRNFWPYLNSKDAKKLATDLYNQLGENALLVIGQYDQRYEEIVE